METGKETSWQENSADIVSYVSIYCMHHLTEYSLISTYTHNLKCKE